MLQLQTNKQIEKGKTFNGTRKCQDATSGHIRIHGWLGLYLVLGWQRGELALSDTR